MVRVSRTTRLCCRGRSRVAASRLLLGVIALGSALFPSTSTPLALANACDTAIKTLPVIFEFDTTVGCINDKDDQASSFTAFQDNNPNRGIPAYQKNLIDLDPANGGTLSLTSTTTISGTRLFGSNFGNDNSQVNALETYFDASALGTTVTKVFTITAQIKGPLNYIDVGREQAAIYFGPDQDNYVKLGVIGGKSGGTSLEFIDEINGQVGELQGAKTSLVSIDAISNTIQTLDLMLVGDQEPGKIAAYYSVNGAAPLRMPFDVTLANTGVPFSKKDLFFNNGQTSAPASRAGILVINKNRGAPIAATFNRFSIIDAQRPGADAGPDQSVLASSAGNPVTVNLVGKGYAPVGLTVPAANYGWTLSGATPGLGTITLNGSGANRSFQAPSSSGVLTFSLVVTDSNGVASFPDTIRVVVAEAPISSLEVTTTSPTVLGQTTVLTATANVQATNVSYIWDFGDGDTDNGQVVKHVYDFAGIYTATVVASNSINTFTQTKQIEIVNARPFANPGNDQVVNVDALGTLDGSASTDPDGHLPLSYAWAQISGIPVTLSSASAVSPTFTAPSTPTLLLFSLVVTDSRGLSSQTQPPQTVAVMNSRPLVTVTPSRSSRNLRRAASTSAVSSEESMLRLNRTQAPVPFLHATKRSPPQPAAARFDTSTDCRNSSSRM